MTWSKSATNQKSHKTEIHIEGDPRYDPKLVRAAKKQQRDAAKQALLSGGPVPATATAAAAHYTNVADDEPRWTVPEICPECGARVDQSTASMAEHPNCEFCERPLPCKPIHYKEDY